MAETKTAAAKGSKQTRSPRYPIIAIDEALNKVKAIYAKDRRALTTFAAILEHMGYKVKEKQGGRSARIVASLRQYGLLEGRANKYQVSDTAFRILELPDDSPERLQLIKEAGLSPPMVSKVLAHYHGELPSDTTLRSYLVLEEKFNRDSAEEFVKVLRRTITIVNPQEGDYNGRELGQDEVPPPGGNKPRMQQQATPQIQLPKPSVGQRSYPLYLSKDLEAALYVPSVMTRAEYDLLKKQIENSLLVMEATSVVETSAEAKDADGAST
jgi:hypothetical protein